MTSFDVKNTGDDSFDFTAALHTYFDVTSPIEKSLTIKSSSFMDAFYVDKTQDPPASRESSTDSIKISEFFERVYAASGKIELQDSLKSRKTVIENSKEWKDTVVWNPFGDENMGADRFVCVESARVNEPVELKSGDKWNAVATIYAQAL